MVRNKTVKYVPGEGMAFGLGSHSIDQALVLFGRPALVTGFFRSLRGIESEVDDTFTIILQYSGEQKDLLVTIKTTIVSLMADQLKTFIRGTEGSFVKVSLLRFYWFLIAGPRAVSDIYSLALTCKRIKLSTANFLLIQGSVLSLRARLENLPR